MPAQANTRILTVAVSVGIALTVTGCTRGETRVWNTIARRLAVEAVDRDEPDTEVRCLFVDHTGRQLIRVTARADEVAIHGCDGPVGHLAEVIPNPPPHDEPRDVVLQCQDRGGHVFTYRPADGADARCPS